MAKTKVHPELTSFLNGNPNATHSELLDFGSKLTKRLINSGEFDAVAGTHDALSEALQAKTAARRALLQEGIQRWHTSSAEASKGIANARATLSGSILPKGISAGKATAFVAGAGLIAAGAYALLRKKEEPVKDLPAQPGASSWVDRVEQQRMREQSAARQL